MDCHPTRDVWKCAVVDNGAPFVTVIGIIEKQELYVVNWDFHQLVIIDV